MRQNTGDFLGTGLMVVVLKHDGIVALLREMLEMSVNICQFSSFEHTPWSVVWASSFVQVNSGQSLSDLSCGQT